MEIWQGCHHILRKFQRYAKNKSQISILPEFFIGFRINGRYPFDTLFLLVKIFSYTKYVCKYCKTVKINFSPSFNTFSPTLSGWEWLEGKKKRELGVNGRGSQNTMIQFPHWDFPWTIFTSIVYGKILLLQLKILLFCMVLYLSRTPYKIFYLFYEFHHLSHVYSD